MPARCKACSRVLKNGGVFAQISFAQPHFRRRYLEAFPCSDDGTAVAEAPAVSEVEDALRGEASLPSSGTDATLPLVPAAGSFVPAYGWRVAHFAFGDEGCLETFMYACKKEAS